MGAQNSSIKRSASDAKMLSLIRRNMDNSPLWFNFLFYSCVKKRKPKSPKNCYSDFV